jgi:hypothetical protein
MGRQFWLGPHRAGQIVRFWASIDVIHLSIDGARIKSLRSHLSTSDLIALAADGAIPAGPSPLPLETDGDALEVERAINRGGLVSLAGHQVLAAEIPGGRPVLIRIEAPTLMFLDPDSRELLRTRPNPLTPAEVRRLQGARPAGPPPRPQTEPVRVQRTVSATGVITVCRQPITLAASTQAARSPSSSPSTRSPSSSTTKPARSAAPRHCRSASSKPTTSTSRIPPQHQQNSPLSPIGPRHD